MIMPEREKRTTGVIALNVYMMGFRAQVEVWPLIEAVMVESKITRRKNIKV